MHTQRTQDALDFGIAHMHAKHAREPVAAQRDCRLDRQMRRECRFADRARLAAGDSQDQASRVFERLARQFGVDAALEALRCIGMHAEPARTARDRRRCEMRGFEEDIAGCVGDAGFETTHDAGQSDRPCVVDDDQEFRIERGLALVEQGEPLPRVRTTNTDRPAQLVGIIGMHRLAEFQHHIGGDVDQQADRTQPGALEALAHPHRSRRLRIDAFDHATAVTRAIGTGIQRDLELPRGG